MTKTIAVKIRFNKGNVHFMGRLLITIIIAGVVFGCNPTEPQQPIEELVADVSLDLSDSIARRIIDQQDHLSGHEVASYLKHENPTYRFLAARAFSSIQSKDHLDVLINLLDDLSIDVRQASAFALGQIGDQAAEQPLLRSFDNVVDSTDDVNTALNATILEAIGKCGRMANLDLLSQVSTYKPGDNHLLYGQARAIYRYMQRNIITEHGTAKMVTLLANPDMPEGVRMLAANYLSRAQVDLADHSELLKLTYANLKEPLIKLFMPYALTKTKDKGAIDQLRASLNNDEDFRLKCNIIKTLGAYDFSTYRGVIQQMLRQKNIHVALTAAETILKESDARYWKSYMTLSLGNYPWQIKTKLLQAVSKFIPAGNAMFLNINQDLIRQRIRQSRTPEEKAAAIQALAAHPSNYTRVIQYLDDAEEPLVRTSIFESLVDLVRSPRFNRLGKKARQTILERIITGLASGDVAQVTIASNQLADPQFAWSIYGIEPTVELEKAKTKLQLPRDSEAHIAVQKALAVHLGSDLDTPEEMLHTHGIDWSVLSALGDTVRATIESSRGTIEVALFPKLAPGTVANFVDLANLNYYASKSFHRVVPGFVIQGGCSRGDGYGSMDYNIRSELNQSYYDAPGKIGMASAGNHTESAQWFITQSATPHLDGRYSLFGEVVYGMNVVNQMEAGDTISSIVIR